MCGYRQEGALALRVTIGASVGTQAFQSMGHGEMQEIMTEGAEV